MAAQERLVDQVADGYEHLYDTVYLRTHPLGCLVGAREGQSRRQVAWRLRQLLLEAIDELDPGPAAPAFSREWRRHRLMVLRYCDGLAPPAVAERLSISLRSYYRELREAFEALAVILEERRAGDGSAGESGEASERTLPRDRLSLLRLEAARLAAEGRLAPLGEVVADATTLVQDMAREAGIVVCAAPDQAAASGMVNRSAVRQVLLGAISYLAPTLVRGRIDITAAVEEDDILLTVSPEGVARVQAGDAADEDAANRLAALGELGRVQGLELAAFARGDLIGLRLRLPRTTAPTILIADDNDDTLQLMERYLTTNGYRAIVARNGAETIATARRCLPHAITLDLMMPGQDGWDVLQTLTNQPETQHIPVIVSSVLSARALALSLGASFFLEKPVSEEALLAALADLGL